MKKNAVETFTRKNFFASFFWESDTVSNYEITITLQQISLNGICTWNLLSNLPILPYLVMGFKIRLDSVASEYSFSATESDFFSMCCFNLYPSTLQKRSNYVHDLTREDLRYSVCNAVRCVKRWKLIQCWSFRPLRFCWLSILSLNLKCYIWCIRNLSSSGNTNDLQP